jgi:outer membrane lipoprotein-sorting protein
MWLSLLVVFVAAGPDAGSADAAFKRMEQQVLQCKSLQVQLEVTAVSGTDTVASMKGRLAVSTGNKVRLEVDGRLSGMPYKMVTVSDGRKQRTAGSGGAAQDRETKKELGELVLGSLTRAGIFVSLFTDFRADPDPNNNSGLEKAFPISDIKLATEEVIAGSEAQAIEYKITPKGATEAIAATVWVDVKTNLPIKRVIALSKGKDTITITESYTKTVVDEKIDEKEFELPK